MDYYTPVAQQQNQLANPLDQYAKVMAIQQGQNQNAMAQYSLAKAQRDEGEQNALRAAIGSGFDPTNAEHRNKLIQASPAAGMGILKQFDERAKADVELKFKQAETRKLHADYYTNESGRVAAMPTDENIKELYAKGVQLGITSQEEANRSTQALIGMPPQKRNEVLLMASAKAKDALDKIMMDAGQAATVAASMRGQDITAATSKRGQDITASTAAAGRGQAERHFQAGQNAPQYMQTDQGLVVLPKKLGAGEQPVGVPVMGAGGEPLGKALKDIPVKVNEAIQANMKASNQLDRALTLLSGKDIGDPAKGGMKGDAAATGFKAYLPPSMLDRLDPTGVDTRAEIADVGSMLVHDRSGAAVTISEYPRLAPFVPSAKDDATAAAKKLRRLNTEIKADAEFLASTYSKEQGYKPNPQLQRGGAKPSASIDALLDKYK